MARIVVTAERTTQRHAPVPLDQHVDFVNLCEDHNAEALIERLGWALADAEDAQRKESPGRLRRLLGASRAY
jgi:hypothetical protein